MPPKGKRKRIVVAAESASTGIVHIFDDVAGFEKQITAFKREHKYKLQPDLVNSLSFWSWIKNQILPVLAPSISWNDPVYRLIYGGFPPTSIVGSIADGGRFNVGGAQIRPEFPDVRKSGCLYAAATLKCCYAEAAGPVGRPEEYELRPTRALSLWDLTQMIALLNRPEIEGLVKSSPVEAIWGYQKVPMIPQLLAHFFRMKGGDGLVFSSTKDPTVNNFAFFLKSDADATATFTATKLN